MMRIAYLSSDFGIPVYGNKGASIHVRELSSAFRATGNDVRIFTCRLGGDPPAEFDIPVSEVRFGTFRKQLVSTLKADPDISDPMMKEIRSMLYSTTLAQEILPELEGWQPDALYERYSLMSTAGVELSRQLGIPLILEVNAPLTAEAETHRGIGFRHTAYEVERNILNAADHICAVSDDLRDWLIESGVQPERITVTPNRVNIDHFGSASGTPSIRPTVGFVGTLKAWHGTETLVRAIGEIARARGHDDAPELLIVGDGPQRPSLEAVAHDLGIAEQVTFTGMVDHNDMPSYIGAMDIAVAPYNPCPDFYFSPLKLFEYMAAGRAIIAADIGQIPEIIEHERTGVLVAPGDVAALARAITRLIDDREFAAALGRNARQDAIERFAWERNAEIVTGLIERARQPLVAKAGGDR